MTTLSNMEKEHKGMPNSPIYKIFSSIIFILNKLNIIEWIKFVLSKHISTIIIVDFYILIKFLFIAWIFIFDVNSLFVEILVWYLIVMNVHTYFFHHLWDDEKSNIAFGMKRSFILLMLSVIFSNICFSYLYYNSFNSCFSLKDNLPFSKSQALLTSFYNSFFSSYDNIDSCSSMGSSIQLIQLMTSFILLSVILSESIPSVQQYNEK